MRTILLGIAALALTTSVASAGKSKQSRYIGIHPVPKAEGGGFCHIEGSHVHVFAADKVQYRDHRGQHHFVGDPVAYGYDGPRHAYNGHHPIQVNAVLHTDEPDTEFCYLNGAHYHYFEPPSGPEFEVRGDVAFYVAEPPPAYIEARPALVKINAVYEPFVYTRPVVTVEAPVGWIGARVEYATPAAVVVQPRGRVIAPAAGVSVDARVHIPMPSLQVELGFGSPGVVVHEHHHYKGKRHGKHKKHKKHRRGWR